MEIELKKMYHFSIVSWSDLYYSKKNKNNENLSFDDDNNNTNKKGVCELLCGMMNIKIDQIMFKMSV